MAVYWHGCGFLEYQGARLKTGQQPSGFYLLLDCVGLEKDRQSQMDQSWTQDVFHGFVPEEKVLLHVLFAAEEKGKDLVVVIDLK